MMVILLAFAIVAYADDTVELAVKTVWAKLTHLGIELAPEKTEVLIMLAPPTLRNCTSP